MTDKATKILLAVIAGCLVLLTVKALKPDKVEAEKRIIYDVNISRIGERPVWWSDFERLFKDK